MLFKGILSAELKHMGKTSKCLTCSNFDSSRSDFNKLLLRFRQESYSKNHIPGYSYLGSLGSNSVCSGGAHRHIACYAFESRTKTHPDKTS